MVAGIDEAGLGPVLGPLVVSATAFDVPDAMADVPLWDTLAAAVARKPGRKPTRIAIGDSKKLYNRKSKRPLEHLERAVLSAMVAAGRHPTSLESLLKIVAPGLGATLAEYPWYAGSSLELPQCLAAAEPALEGNALAVAMGDVGVRILAMRSEVVCVRQFNALIGTTRNKSGALGDITARLMDYLWNKSGDGRLQIHIDRQGGRQHYLPLLQRIWPEAQFKILDESETSSGYRVSQPPREAEIWYRVSSEQAQLPVALASMLCKYIRELMMDLFNAYWREKVAGLAPTAGYYVDGRRFFAEIAETMRREGISKDIVYRCR